MTGRRNKQIQIIRITALVGAFFYFGSTEAQTLKPVVQADITHAADTAHLEFKGLKNWRYELNRDGGKKIMLTVPAMDDASLARLQSFHDGLVQSVSVDKTGPDGNFIVTFELARADVDSFDYLTDDPSRLIVDFYPKPADNADAKKQQVAEAKPAAPAAAKAKKKKKPHAAQASTAKDESRKPAGDEFLSVDAKGSEQGQASLQNGIFDGGDDNYDRFRIKDYEIREDAIIAARENIYIPFPMLKMKVSQLDKLMEQQPEYIIHPKDTRENKEARLLQTLFARKRYAVFLKTYAYFTHKYPDSEYTEILKNLTAAVHLERWREEGKSSEFDQAQALYGELVQKFPESPLRERNYLILGFAQMERGDALNTLQNFEGFLKTFPKSAEIPAVRSALAEAYMILSRFDEAAAQYATIIKDFAKTPHAQEARYRLGDVQFAKGDYSAAIRDYEAAIKDLPGQEKTYPNADFNMAEARFWQKDYKKSLNDYIRFVDLYPTHEHGGYALTRIGELLGTLGADQRRVMGAFLESYFRFPTHPGAQVARIRMLTQQMKGMKPGEMKKAVEEIDGYANKLDLPGIKEFATLMKAEGLSHRGEYNAALESLIGYYQKNPSSVNLATVKNRILRNIADELKGEVEHGDFLKALAFYNKYSETWLKNSNRVDIPFFKAGAYEKAGAYSEAERIYRSVLEARQALVGTPAEKERRVQEYLPSLNSLHLRLAASMAEDRDYIGAYQNLKAIPADAQLQPGETIERVQLTALIAEQRNDFKRAREALAELAQKWKGDPALLAPVNLKLAQTYNKMGNFKEAEAQADKVLNAEGGDTKIDDKTIAGALTAKAEGLVGEKRQVAAVEVYQKLLERFEDKMPLANVRYKVGQILYDRGDVKGASDVWKRLQGTPNDLLYKLGNEKLEESQWQNDYTKYMNRIPAMAHGPNAKETK